MRDNTRQLKTALDIDKTRQDRARKTRQDEKHHRIVWGEMPDRLARQRQKLDQDKDKNMNCRGMTVGSETTLTIERIIVTFNIPK